MKLATRLLRIVAAILAPARPMPATTSTRPASSTTRPRRALPPRPKVVMPPDPDRLPWPGAACYCGKRWTATPQGYAAADRHNDLDLPACGEAFRQRQRDRAAQRRAIIRADPELSRQQRDYERAVRQRSSYVAGDL
jgi:hypothetical protein